MYKTFKG